MDQFAYLKPSEEALKLVSGALQEAMCMSPKTDTSPFSRIEKGTHTCTCYTPHVEHCVKVGWWLSYPPSVKQVLRKSSLLIHHSSLSQLQ